MPFFTSETEEGTSRTSEEIALMNTRYDQQVEDVEPVDEETGQTEESRSEEIEKLIDDIRSDMDGANEEEIALLFHLHNEGETDYWLDDLTTHIGGFYTADLIDVGHGTSEEWGVVSSNGIEDVYRDYCTGYIDDCVLPEIPERYRQYFDTDLFVSDMEKGDGWGAMSSYDGDYQEVTIGGKTWYLFRMN
jgi:hypothetical protein